MKVFSWNVNGIRAVISKNFEEFLKTHKPDVLGLQEIKAKFSDVKFPDSILNKYDVHFSSADRPGYSGTAFLISKEYASHFEVRHSIGDNKFDCEGRTIEIESDDLYLYNGYFPNGQDDHGRVGYKLEYSFNVLDRALKKSSEKMTLITGDFNTAHTEIDLKNPKNNKYTTGFLNIEREYLDQLIEAGFVDVHRHFNPNLTDLYTWWSYRNAAREKNVGWRLDYFFVDKNNISNIKKSSIHHDVLGSDHCPISVEF